VANPEEPAATATAFNEIMCALIGMIGCVAISFAPSGVHGWDRIATRTQLRGDDNVSSAVRWRGHEPIRRAAAPDAGPLRREPGTGRDPGTRRGATRESGP
jgi:hypothetical protein